VAYRYLLEWGPLKFDVHSGESMEPSIAYLADGRLFLKLAGKEVREVESKFGNQVIARFQKNSEREAWKSQGVWGSGGMGMPSSGRCVSVCD